eukprot:UN03740
MSHSQLLITLCILRTAIMALKSAICPDVLDEVAVSLDIEFDGEEIISRGTTVNKQTARQAPNVEWRLSNDNSDYYTILMVDPDAPSHTNPRAAEWLHWMVTNIPYKGDNIDEGDIIKMYAPPTPPSNTGDHRYCIYAFQQLGGYDANLKDYRYKGRAKFNTKQFLESQGADLELYAASFFYCNHDF